MLVACACLAVVRVRSSAGGSAAADAADDGAGSGPEEGEVVLAQFDDQTVTDGDLRRFLGAFPHQPWSDNASNRKYLLNVVVSERLAAHAARNVELESSEAALPLLARRKLKLQRWMAERASEEGWNLSDGKAYRQRLREAAKSQREETPVSVLTDALALASLDVRAGYESLIKAYRGVPADLRQPARGEFSLGEDRGVRHGECRGVIDPDSAAIDARCGCMALDEAVMWEHGLYFDLAFSGLGPNILGRFNIVTPRCHERVVFAPNSIAQQSQWQAQKEEFSGWTPQVRIVELEAGGADPDRLKRILETSKWKVASCTIDMGLNSLQSRVAVTFGLSPSGAMDDFKIETLEGTETGPCLEEAFSRLRYPESTRRAARVRAVLQLSAHQG